MAGLGPATHEFLSPANKLVGPRAKPGDDDRVCFVCLVAHLQNTSSAHLKSPGHPSRSEDRGWRKASENDPERRTSRNLSRGRRRTPADGSSKQAASSRPALRSVQSPIVDGDVFPSLRGDLYPSNRGAPATSRRPLAGPITCSVPRGQFFDRPKQLFPRARASVCAAEYSIESGLHRWQSSDFR